MNLTQEHFNKAIKGLVTIKELDERFEKQTRILMAYSDRETEKLAEMVAAGFDEMRELLDVRQRVAQLEKSIKQIMDALHV